MIDTLEKEGYDLGLNKSELAESLKLARFVFNS
jgi:hydroxymethylglutaryl-CoA lyase